MANRQVVLDTETTGLSPKGGHRIIEIGCVEIIDRKLTGKTYSQYIHPDREIDAGAMAVHGITLESLEDKPRFREIADDLKEFLSGSELIIHNAKFDVGFLENEFMLLNDPWQDMREFVEISCTLVMAREKHPGQRNSLDALCKRYNINNAHRELHGALLDSEILADVYLAMTGGQGALSFAQDKSLKNKQAIEAKAGNVNIIDVALSDEANQAHLNYLELFNKKE